MPAPATVRVGRRPPVTTVMEGLALDDALRQEFLRGASVVDDLEMVDAVRAFVFAPERR